MYDTDNLPLSRFSQCIKTGFYFTLDTDDHVFVGDLFYDFGGRKFQVRGIPTFEGRMRHIFDTNFKGPVYIDMVITGTKKLGFDRDSRYAAVDFTTAKVTSALATHLEEWHGDLSVMQAVEQLWEIKQDLTWYKS